MTTLVIMAIAAAAAIALATWQARRTVAAPTTARGEPPTSLDRRDFRSPQTRWLIAVFTSASCASCAAVVAELRGHVSDDLIVDEVEIGTELALHRKYAIESVPTAVIVDEIGNAKLAFVGPLGPEHRAALAELLSHT